MALRYFVNGGLNNSWNQTGVQSNWSLTSNGAGGQTVPSASDDVIFDAFSPACTLTGAATCLSFNASTYGTKLWALGTNNISVAAGAFTLGTGMTVSGTGTLIRTAGGNTLTSNGVTWPGSIQFNLNVTNTWGDGWTILGSLTSINQVTINGTFNFTIGGSLACAQLTSTSTYTLNGTGNLNGGYVSCTVIIATAFTITLPTLLRMGGILRLTSGTVNVAVGHILQLGSCTLDTDRTSTGGNKISFYDCATINSNTSTLQSNLTITRNFSNPNNFTTVGAFTIFLGGSLLSNGQIIGAVSLEMDGSVSSTVSTGSILINFTINKTGVAVVTFASTLTWGAANKILTINSAVNFAANLNTLSLGGGPLTIINNFPANSFFNLNIQQIILNINGAAIRIASNLTLTGPSNTTTTFAGAFGWDCNNLICSTAGPYSIILREGVTYRTRTAVSLTGGTAANRVTMQSSSLTILAIWTLDFGATQSMIYVNGTRIDSSGEQTIWSFGVSAANVSTSINWNPGVPIRTVVHTFVN